MAMVCSPDEQKRLTVMPAVDTGQPARIAICRAMLRPVAPFGIGAAHHHVLDLGRVEPRALDGVAQGVAAERGPMGHVERAFPALAKRRARGGDNDGIWHPINLPHRADAQERRARAGFLSTDDADDADFDGEASGARPRSGRSGVSAGRRESERGQKRCGSDSRHPALTLARLRRAARRRISDRSARETRAQPDLNPCNLWNLWNLWMIPSS